MSPKTLSVLTLLICIFAVPASADNFTITGGKIVISGGVVTSSLKAPRYVLTGIQGDEFFTNGLGWQSQCLLHDCTVSDIQGIGATGLTQFSPPGFVIVNGTPSGFNGLPKFTTATFNTSLGTDGVLTVSGLALGGSTIAICQPPGSECVETGLVFAFSNKPWHYTAHFLNQDPDNPELYVFSDLTLTTVPEPTTMALVAMGLGVVGLSRRKKMVG